jgi:hypothetical protein
MNYYIRQSFTSLFVSAILFEMVYLTVLVNGTIKVSGKTFEHKETIKELGGHWCAQTKTWIVPNTPTTKKVMMDLTTTRHCGHCGDVGHFKPKCEKYHVKRQSELKKISDECIKQPSYKFKRFEKSGYCSCRIEQKKYGYEDFSVPMPQVCNVCSIWCCGQATPCLDGVYVENIFQYTCPRHGSSIEQFLNDTRGT